MVYPSTFPPNDHANHTYCSWCLGEYSRYNYGPHNQASCSSNGQAQFLNNLGQEDGIELFAFCAEKSKDPQVELIDPQLSALLFDLDFGGRRSFHYNNVAHPVTNTENSKNRKEDVFPSGPARNRLEQKILRDRSQSP